MMTNCKQWKLLLFLTAAVTLVSSFHIRDIYAAENSVNIVNENNIEMNLSELNTTSNMMDSDKMTAGVAVILDADISMEDEKLIALAKSRTLSTDEMLNQEQKQETSTLVMAKVNEYVNIRETPNQDAQKLGMLYKDCGGDIIERNGEWSKIKSGDVTGWVRNKYLYFGEEAEKVAKEVGVLTAYSKTETLRVRAEADKEAKVIGLLANGEAVEAVEEEGEWVCVSYEGATGYVSSQYVDVEFDIDKAESMAVIEAREEAARIEAENKAKKEEEERAAAKAAEATRIAQKEAVLATASDIQILGALIQCEAGGEPYEGQLAVGSVVMNRVRCGGYPNNIADVIYASGQFVPASKGKMETLILTGNIKPSCIQAATEAINGACNVGDALHFRRSSKKQGIRIGNHVFW